MATATHLRERVERFLCTQNCSSEPHIDRQSVISDLLSFFPFGLPQNMKRTSIFGVLVDAILRRFLMP